MKIGKLLFILHFSFFIFLFSACAPKPFFHEDETLFQGEQTPPPGKPATFPTDVPGHIRALAGGDPDRRLLAARDLGAAGSDAREALPALLLIAKDEKEATDLRLAAIESVGAIGAWNEEVAPGLASLVRDPQPRVRLAAVRALAQLEIAAAPATDALIAALRDAELRPDATRSLAAIGAQAVEPLARAAEDPDPADGAVRKAARDALASIGSPSVEPLIKGLRGRADYESSVSALARIGNPAVQSLMKGLEDKSDRVRRGAADALRKIGPGAKEAAPALAKAANDANPQVRAAAQSALAAIGPTREPEVKAILWGVRDHDARVRNAAATALRKIGPDAEPPAVGALSSALTDRRWHVRAEAADALGRVGAGAAVAVPDLAKRLVDADAKVRSSAARALGEIGPAAADALPVLEKLKTDPDPAVRAAAARAAAKIKREGLGG